MSRGSSSGAAGLPRFTDHAAHEKLQALERPEPPEAFVQHWLAQVTEGRDPGSIRVLDVGCGRGGTVAWLLTRGYDAYGIDVDPRYVDSSRDHLASIGGDGRVRVVDVEGDYPFDDQTFDVVLSDQVIEHVQELAPLAAQVQRVTKPAGVGLHVFPARWRPVEPHMFVPLAHWLPKGPARSAAIGLAIRLGRSADYFSELDARERTRIFASFSETETFYRAPRVIARAFRATGLDADVHRITRDRLRFGRPVLSGSGPALDVLAWGYRSTRVMTLATRRP